MVAPWRVVLSTQSVCSTQRYCVCPTTTKNSYAVHQPPSRAIRLDQTIGPVDKYQFGGRNPWNERSRCMSLYVHCHFFQRRL